MQVATQRDPQLDPKPWSTLQPCLKPAGDLAHLWLPWMASTAGDAGILGGQSAEG